MRQPSLSRLRAPLKITAVACAVLGLSGAACGAITALLALLVAANKFSPSAMAVVCCAVAGSVGGILLLPLPTIFERWIVQRNLSQRDANFGFGVEHGIHVALEYAPTYGSLKILAEDVGLVYFHPDAHYVKIHGLSYEYLIQGKDVVHLSLHSNRKSVLLSYQVGAERIDLAVVPRSLRAERERVRTGSSLGFFEKMRHALEPAQSSPGTLQD